MEEKLTGNSQPDDSGTNHNDIEGVGASGFVQSGKSVRYGSSGLSSLVV